MQACASEFIGFIATEVADRIKAEGRKTMRASDMMISLKTLGFDPMIPIL